MGKLQDRVALITGGTRGIGRGIADAFLAEGAKVVVTGRSDDKGKQAVEEMGGGDRVAFVQGDCTSQADVERMVDETVALFGSVDILVNNAGGSWGFARVHEMEDEAWNGVLDFNLNAAFWASRRALPTMLANQWGRLIAISSVEGKEASKPTVSHYITNKHALHGLVKAIAVEYGTDGITSNAICPGAVETDLMLGPGKAFAESNDIPYEEFKKTYAEASMIKRLNTVEEVAAMAVLLASDVGGGMTGSLFNVDGGTSSW